MDVFSFYASHEIQILVFFSIPSSMVLLKEICWYDCRRDSRLRVEQTSPQWAVSNLIFDGCSMGNLGPMGIGGIIRGYEGNMVREFFIPADFRLAAEVLALMERLIEASVLCSKICKQKRIPLFLSLYISEAEEAVKTRCLDSQNH